jgi:acyl dehydratase
VSALRDHLKLLTGKRQGLADGQAMPAISVERPVGWSQEKVRSYRAITGFSDDGMLPFLCPQVMAVGLHLELFAHPQFPFRALGLVHIENHVTSTRRVAETTELTLKASVTHARRDSHGTLFDLVTEASDRDGSIGQWIATILARSPQGQAAAKDPSPVVTEESVMAASCVVAAPEDIGRRYARIAGDLNPIHQRAIMARAFGFKRAIAHGMWTLARVLADTAEHHPQQATKLHVKFRKPLFLPGRFVIEARRSTHVTHLTALPTQGTTPHLTATLSRGLKPYLPL